MALLYCLVLELESTNKDIAHRADEAFRVETAAWAAWRSAS